MRPWISGAMLMKSTDRNAFVSILIGSTLTLEITDVFRHITEKTTWVYNNFCHTLHCLLTTGPCPRAADHLTTTACQQPAPTQRRRGVTIWPQRPVSSQRRPSADQPPPTGLQPLVVHSRVLWRNLPRTQCQDATTPKTGCHKDGDTICGSICGILTRARVGFLQTGKLKQENDERKYKYVSLELSFDCVW